MTSFAGKTVLVTGSGGGLGKALAKAYLDAGAQVVICDINEARLKEVEAEFSSKGKILTHQVDITNEDSIKSLVEAAVKTFGRLDVLVNNAGIMDKFAPAGDLDKALWDRVFAVNVTGAFLVTKHVVNQFIAQGAGSTAIVNVGSLASVKGYTAGVAYTSSKHALVGLTKHTAVFYRSKGVRCNVIQPGGMQTNIFENPEGIHPEGFGLFQQTNPKLMDPSSTIPLEKVADLVLYLSSEQASFINGQQVSIDDGIVSAV